MKAKGLTNNEVLELQAKYGKNELTEEKPKTLIQRFWNQIKDPMVGLLILASLVSAFVGGIIDAVVIWIVILIQTIIGVAQESQSQKVLDEMKELSTISTLVERDGIQIAVPINELVPGDIVYLNSGDMIPADLVMLSGDSVQVEEAILTGESIPVGKLPVKSFESVDKSNMLFMNTGLVTGELTGKVLTTGMNTEVGKIATLLKETKRPLTPLQANMAKLGKQLTIGIIFIAIIVFILGTIKGIASPINMLLTAISLAVAAIPEGLPAIITIILALGTQLLAKHNAVVKNLPSVETLGAIDVLATDKTGTLTENKMTVTDLFWNDKSITADKNINDAFILNTLDLASEHDKTKQEADTTELAIVDYVRKQDAKIINYKQTKKLPFDSSRKMMSQIYDLDNEIFTAVLGDSVGFIKGAPEVIIEKSKEITDGKTVKPLEKDRKIDLIKATDSFAEQGKRVLAFAVKNNAEPEDVENDLIFVGLVAIMDPAKESVPESLLEIRNAGITPVMITGDSPITAKAIANKIGLASDAKAISGAEIDQKLANGRAETMKELPNYQIFARVTPEHKSIIIRSFQDQGKLVAMTGDGVNDAPSIKQANIGIAMGRVGSNVAKNTSDMILLDDNYSTIVKAIHTGRKIFANIQKTMVYLLSANLGEVITVFVMTMMGLDVLLPIQILWINLVTDTFPAISLGLEPAEDDVLKQKPRGKNASFLANGIGQSIIYQGMLEGAITLGVYALALKFPEHHNLTAIHADALTMSFVTLSLIQLFHAYNCKDLFKSIFTRHLFQNKQLNIAVIISIISIAIPVMVPALNKLFHVSNLSVTQWAIVVAASFSIIILVELVKLINKILK